MIQNIMKSYDDELRIFLVTCLRNISYLKNLPEENLVHISMLCIAQQSDKDSLLYSSNKLSGKSEIGELVIIFEGQIAVTTQVDGNTELVLDYVGKGTVLNASNFLSLRSSAINYKCLTSVTYYYLPLEVLQGMSHIYQDLVKNLKVAQKESRYNKLLDLNMMDYQETNIRQNKF